MALYCSHCGTKLEDFMKFCYNCGNLPKGATATQKTLPPKVEYKQVSLQLYKKPYIQYYIGEPNATSELQKIAQGEAEPIIFDQLKPYFDEGWQLDGTFKSSVSMIWGISGFMRDYKRLSSANVRLIRYK